MGRENKLSLWQGVLGVILVLIQPLLGAEHGSLNTTRPVSIRTVQAQETGFYLEHILTGFLELETASLVISISSSVSRGHHGSSKTPSEFQFGYIRPQVTLETAVSSLSEKGFADSKHLESDSDLQVPGFWVSRNADWTQKLLRWHRAWASTFWSRSCMSSCWDQPTPGLSATSHFLSPQIQSSLRLTTTDGTLSGKSTVVSRTLFQNNPATRIKLLRQCI